MQQQKRQQQHQQPPSPKRNTRWGSGDEGGGIGTGGEGGRGEVGARERKTFGGGGVASLDACNQFRTARAITVSARSHVDSRRR